MAELQRSVTSFRRQGSSGMVWDDKFLAGLWDQNQSQNQNQNQNQNQEGANKDNQDQQESEREQGESQNVGIGSSNPMLERSRSEGARRPYRTVNVAPPSKDPPSPKLPTCGLCGFFGKPASNPKSKKRR